eukprot:6455494-Amphidinium_carterae.1
MPLSGRGSPSTTGAYDKGGLTAERPAVSLGAAPARPRLALQPPDRSCTPHSLGRWGSPPGIRVSPEVSSDTSVAHDQYGQLWEMHIHPHGLSRCRDHPEWSSCQLTLGPCGPSMRVRSRIAPHHARSIPSFSRLRDLQSSRLMRSYTNILKGSIVKDPSKTGMERPFLQLRYPG